MKTATSPAEAQMIIHAELLRRSALCLRLQYVPYPSSGDLVLICAELNDGTELQVLTKLDWPVAVHGDEFDLEAIKRQFFMPSTAKH
jgi:hypothetical protein